MSHRMYAYFLSDSKQGNEQWIFDHLLKLFEGSDDLTTSIDSDPFDEQKNLQLNFDGY